VTSATPGGTTTALWTRLSVPLSSTVPDRRKDRESYAEMWRRWIYDDYYRSYLIPLEKYGLKILYDLVEKSLDRLTLRA